MPLLIILGILLIYGVYNIYMKATEKKTPYTRDEINSMLKEMRGASDSECRKILRKYHKDK